MPSAGVHVTLPDYYSPEHMGLIVPKTKDGRVVFMLPWQNATVAGTTGGLQSISSCPLHLQLQAAYNCTCAGTPSERPQPAPHMWGLQTARQRSHCSHSPASRRSSSSWMPSPSTSQSRCETASALHWAGQGASTAPEPDVLQPALWQQLIGRCASSSAAQMQLLSTEVKHRPSLVQVRRADVTSAWSGIRPLAIDPKAKDTASALRDHIVVKDDDGLITITGAVELAYCPWR
jgi:hypothetical protein